MRTQLEGGKMRKKQIGFLSKFVGAMQLMKRLWCMFLSIVLIGSPTFADRLLGNRVKPKSLTIKKVFCQEDEKLSTPSKYIVIETHSNINIDGDLSEWQNVKPIALNKRSQADDKWQGIKDLSAQAYFMWDKSNLYFGRHNYALQSIY